MQFTVTIDTDNAAFDGDDCGAELARILREIAQKVEDGADEGNAFDINGNRVGSFELAGR